MISKKPNSNFLLKFCAVVSLLFIFSVPTFAYNNDEPVNADEALETLMRGNERFVEGRFSKKDILNERPRLAAGQKPYAIVLACADSRVPPELLFDESLGRIFVIRVAGNVIDPVVLGSIEYAVEHLHVPLLFVLGHESCGAVKAKLAGGHFPPNIAALLSRISPAVNKVRTLDLDEKSSLNMAIKENVSYQMQMSVFDSEVLREALREKHLKIAGGVYDLDTGKVEIVSTDVALQSFGGKEANHATEKSEDKNEEPKAEKENKKEKKEEKKSEKADSRVEENRKKSEPVKTEKSEDKKESKKPSTHPVKLSKDEIVAEAESKDETNGVSYEKVSAGLERPQTFQEYLQYAFDNKGDVITRTSLLMRDEQDRCAKFDCRYLPAGEKVKLASPFLLNISGRPFMKVRYKGQSFYVLANATDFQFSLN